MKIVFFGDIVGKNGRVALAKYISSIRRKYSPDFIIANGENASHGKGLTQKNYIELTNLGIDVITLGNHYNAKDEIYSYIDNAPKLVKPLNVKDERLSGEGSKVFEKNGLKIRVSNLLGEAFMLNEVDDAYSRLIQDSLLNKEKCVHIVDFHAESTSEKQILGYLLDGLVSAVIGTHTHVQTNDARILKNGTAYISDAGMCGASNGVIGFDKNSVIEKIVYGKKTRFEIDENDISIINGVYLEVDDQTFKTTKIELINILEGIK